MASIGGLLSSRTAMLVNGLPPLLRLIALFCGSGPMLAMAAQPLTAQDARDTIVHVLAGPNPAALSGVRDGLLALAALCALTALVIAIVSVTMHRRQRLPVACSPLPAPSPDTSMVAQADALWPQSPDQALGLLYSGLLRRLALDYHLKVPAGATEQDVLAQVASLQLSGLEAFTRQLVEQWQRAAYGGHRPSSEAWAQLLAGWHHLFPTDVAR
jgi:hypothetical protein